MPLAHDQFDQLTARMAEHYPAPVKASVSSSSSDYCSGGAMVLAALDCGLLSVEEVANVVQPDRRRPCPSPALTRAAVRQPTPYAMSFLVRLLNPALSLQRAAFFAREILYTNDNGCFGDALALIKAALTEEAV